MRIGVYPADKGGCGYYRLIWPAMALRDAGHDITILEPGVDWPPAVIGTKRVGSIERRRIVDAQPPPFDVVVVQRPAKWQMAGLIRAWRVHGVRVVVDLDDDLAAMDGSHVGWHGYHPRTSPEENWKHVEKACAVADRVTVTTMALAAKYHPDGQGAMIVPNFVPAAFLDVHHTDRGRRLGWTGTTLTHPGDLRIVGPAVARELRDRPWRFRVIGPAEGVARDLGIPAGRIQATGWKPLADYPKAMTRIDVGVVPLQQSPFNAAKSWLKMLEFAALGVPVVASPTPANSKLHNYGVGMLADRPREWARALGWLMDNADVRDTLSGKGREVAARLTIEGNIDRWAEPWTHW